MKTPNKTQKKGTPLTWDVLKELGFHVGSHYWKGKRAEISLSIETGPSTTLFVSGGKKDGWWIGLELDRYPEHSEEVELVKVTTKEEVKRWLRLMPVRKPNV